MLPFGVTIPVTVPQRSEIPEGLKNYLVYIVYNKCRYIHIHYFSLMFNLMMAFKD